MSIQEIEQLFNTEILTTMEVREILDISEETMRRFTRQGILGFTRKSHTNFYSTEEVLALRK